MMDTKIEWAAATFNPWYGCAPVSAGCERCYAKTMATRFGFPWGLNQPRKITSEARWHDVEKWDRMAAFKAMSNRVFCGSMCDVFEARPDLVAPRQRLFQLIERTPHLVWMLLTKRIGNAAQLVPWKPEQWPDNVWLGTTVENNTMAKQRIPVLLKSGAGVTFISGEPLLERVDWNPYVQGPGEPTRKLLILGCESGHQARPCDNDWIRAGVAQAQAAGVQVFVKQLNIDGRLERDMDQFPKDMRVRQMLERFNP